MNSISVTWKFISIYLTVYYLDSKPIPWRESMMKYITLHDYIYMTYGQTLMTQSGTQSVIHP